ncbi:transmembrane protein 47-like [Branchiostoma floridae]|uniref:Transmembrane protein 47-like n=1 Tax=Branchiostoma floridae TaxID=7739 RepID=A0A9J7NBA6_BRAFL|nr:transmembrane protein 47-like [Branchiostoma floridae]
MESAEVVTTTTTEVVLQRPLKFIGIVAAFLGSALIVVCMVSDIWVLGYSRADTRTEETLNFYQGLWALCGDYVGTPPPPGSDSTLSCRTPQEQAWVQATAAFVLVNMLLSVAGLVLGVLAFCVERYRRLYRLAGILLILSVVSGLVSLVVFPALFHMDLTETLAQTPTAAGEWFRDNWEFGWGYGVGWGAVFFNFGASLIFLCGKDRDEIKQTTEYYMSAENDDL